MEQPTWIGRSLNGRYKIDALLGSGGMSAVYKAFDPNLRRVVAIKLIHPHLSTDIDFIYRFKKEAASVAAFRHPNIVQVYDFNVDGEVYYMVLEFVPGETLQDRLKHLKNSNTPMPMDQAVRILLHICDALSYAHKQGLIHRDIKPANIMLDVHGQAILMDFGIVKILGDTSHTATGAVVGTARYMSPEVIRSEVPDERSDLYSLGVTFFEMLGGQPPFNADSAMSLLMRHLNDPVPDLNSLRPDVPAELKRIVNKALEKDRENRYRNAEAMAGDLKRFLASLEPATSPLSATPPAPDTALTDPKTTASPLPGQPEPVTQPWSAPTLADRTFAEQAAVTEIPVQATRTEMTVPDVVEQVRTSAHQPEPVPPETPAAKPASASSPFIKFGVIGVVALGLLALSIFLVGRNLIGAPDPSVSGTSFAQTIEAERAAIFATNTALAQQTQAAAPSVTLEATLEPTQSVATPTETLVPASPTPTTPYVLITDIRLENQVYVVDYEVHNFPESPSLHVHMFFDTVMPEQAGSPGSGPWQLTWGAYGNPPFTKYGPANRPENATQMCALVANPNHSVNLGTGNCYDLPN
jgi:serine/threonine protein kinase